jgi:hypothetical protein
VGLAIVLDKTLIVIFHLHIVVIHGLNVTSFFWDCHVAGTGVMDNDLSFKVIHQHDVLSIRLGATILVIVLVFFAR